MNRFVETKTDSVAQWQNIRLIRLMRPIVLSRMRFGGCKIKSLNDRMCNHPEITPFRLRVFTALLEVPRGFVTTYGALALRIGCSSARAVGGALRRNPLAPEVPCHRVVAADLTIGGFAGQRSGEMIEKKRALLKDEGVCFDDNLRVDQRSLWR